MTLIAQLPYSNAIHALTVEELSAGYHGVDFAISNISFTLGVGERVALIGPNGAGKSTLFKALVGMIPHQSGYISLHGEDCRTSHKMFGYVPQQEAIDWSFPATVEDVVMMGRVRKIGWFKMANKHDRHIVHEALDQVGMANFANRQIGQLSGGQKRRVFIARALAQETDVLLLDEPFNGVDVTAEAEIFATLESLQEKGITMLIATHDLALANTRFDRVLALNCQLIADGEPKDVFTPDILRRVYGNRVGVFEYGGQATFILEEPVA
ncbi:MAG TPA: metal ABC transporter ATP-binding protein [Aggregatilineales bacterium]|nr:metal ABC transporter ATP-binding protein [Aggregatilineales bacterium]